LYSETSQKLNTNTAEPEHPTTYASENEVTTTSNTAKSESQVPGLTLRSNVTSTADSYPISTVETTQKYETTNENSESWFTSSLETGVTMEPSLIVHQHSTTSHKIKTRQTSRISKPTTQPESNWSDYWSDENWSEEWPSEFWSDVFKETENPTYSTTHSEYEKHSSLSNIKTYTHTRRKSYNEHSSISRVQTSVSSTQTTEGSFGILPTSHMPKETSHSAEHTSHVHPTEEPQNHTERHHTEENHTVGHSTEEHKTELHHSEGIAEKQPLSLTSSITESSESIQHTSERQYHITSKSKEEAYLSSTSESHSEPSLTSLISISPLSDEQRSLYTSEKHTKTHPRTPISTGSPLSTSTHPMSKFPTVSSHHPKTTNYSKRSKLTSTGSTFAETTTTHLFSRTYPTKKSYSPIFTLKPAPSMLSLGNTSRARPIFQTNYEETETDIETETLYITILSSTELQKSEVPSTHLGQPSSSRSLTVSANESTPSSLVRPYNILKPNEETELTSNESNASKMTICYVSFVPCFILLMLL